MQNRIYALVCITAAWCWSKGALAHDTANLSEGILSGLTHPFYGWDHIAAMVAVGLWGAVLERPAIWVLPIVFPIVMSIGAAAGILGLSLPFTEIGIALSGIALGLLVVFFSKVSLALAAVLVGMFAIFHGHAHGTELPFAIDQQNMFADHHIGLRRNTD
ncbi:MAG: HupE/UreJ family protein [Pseudomonadota bacterium]